MPFDIEKRPFCQCTLMAATIITDSISAGPTGPRKPNASPLPAARRPKAARGRGRPI